MTGDVGTAYRVLGLARGADGGIEVWTPRLGFLDELTARLYGVRLLVEECLRDPAGFARQERWVELTEGVGWDGTWYPCDGGRRSDTGRLSPVNGDVMWELGQPLATHQLPEARLAAPPVLDLPWFPAAPADAGRLDAPWPGAAGAGPAPEPPRWWRIYGFIHVGPLTRLALFEPQEFGRADAARRAAERELARRSRRAGPNRRPLRYSVEMHAGGYVQGRWVTTRHVATAHLDTAHPATPVHWTTPPTPRRLVREAGG